MSEFQKVDANTATSDLGFTVKAGYRVAYIENGVTTDIDAEHLATSRGIILYLRRHGPRAIPDGDRIYGNVARALAFLGYQPETWIDGEPPRGLSFVPQPPETAPVDGGFIWADFRDDARGETAHWAVAWDNVAAAWVTRLGRSVEARWRMERWGPELNSAGSRL